MFKKEELDNGRLLATAKLLPHLQQISWKDTSINGMISYVVHHRFFNNTDTKAVLSYLSLTKYVEFDLMEIITTAVDVDAKSVQIAILKTIVDQYIDSRDYKLIQYIYDEDEADIFRYALYIYLSFEKSSAVWMNSIMSWDISFYKFLFIKIICAIPPDMRQVILPAIYPDEKFGERLTHEENNKLLEYYRHKTDMIKSISKTKRPKTH